ncbi:alanine--tRNA ligase-related protein [Sporosarcina sp. E16_8]|uniref:alanyl-tRNA editing protein n=1 Tax=Sporosarcina sp. E16_8 TaxID=2789295 RepID=UPI001A93844E|nr:alanine--tRNA ligase-related protein [Sporosarcina sp. E16_8]MBO0586629.1 alanyl-tRNA editing protein [Sporosarcina sp. E16_8]
MLKDRLYYADPYRNSFTAQIIKTAQDAEGNHYVVLDNTAFYPTGGGQPHDLGTLNGIAVLNVEEVEDEIRHTLADSLGSATEVEGVIDWERRSDHMQQHAGQHILSAAFVELFEFPTVSFHLGKEIVSIDLDVEDVSPEQLNSVEKLANDIILENRLIEIKWVTEDELHHYPLRKQLAVTDEIRLVIIPNFDYNGCGGTHPSATGQVSALKILSTEKHRGKVRVHFVCGGRVLQQLQRKNQELAETSRLVSAPDDGVADAVQKLLEMNHSLEKSLENAQEALLAFESKALLDQQEQGIVKAFFTDRTVQQLQKLARLLVAEADEIIVLLVAENDNRLQFVAARGASVETSMKQVSSAALPLINGKGGGNESFVQGGVERLISAEQLLTVMEGSR